MSEHTRSDSEPHGTCTRAHKERQTEHTSEPALGRAAADEGCPRASPGKGSGSTCIPTVYTVVRTVTESLLRAGLHPGTRRPTQPSRSPDFAVATRCLSSTVPCRFAGGTPMMSFHVLKLKQEPPKVRSHFKLPKRRRPGGSVG